MWIGNLLCNLAIYCVNFGVNSIFQKFCPCKKNDKYEVWTNTTSYSVLWWPDDNNLSPNCYKSVVQLLKLSLVLSLSYRQRFPQPYPLEVIKGGILNSSHPCIVFLHFEFWFWLIWPYYSNIINWNKCNIDAPPKRQGKIRVIKIEILYWCTPTSVQMNFQLESLSLVLS